MRDGTSLLKIVGSGLLVIVFCLSNLGCKAGPAKNAGFVDPKFMANDKTLPFHGVWKQPGLDFSKYKKIYIAPVDTSHMLELTDWQKGDRKDQFKADVETLARYTQNAVKKAFKEDKNHHFTVLDDPTHDKDAITFNISLTEVVPSKVVLNALGYAPFFIGTGLTVVRTIAQDESTAAFEARMLDASTGQTIVMIADREKEQMAVVTVRGLTWYSHCQAIISQWASQFVQMTNQKPGEAIKDSDPFTLQPW
ncbi:MAG TPA: DUF3313 family protein [Tepidisphaeraceae bacterium]|nr:DUF3313 family protein [Tepidisphaeraceae bacterium]